jgi:LysR family nitrogen assimilation transcriptional regulator
VPQKGFEVIPLIEEEVFLVGRRADMPANRKTVRLAELKHYPLILPSRLHSSRRLLEELAGERALTIHVAAEVDDPSLIRSLLRHGLGFSLLSEGAFRSELKLKELAAVALRPAMYWPLALVRSTAQPRTALVDAVVAGIRATVREASASGSWPGRHLDP